MSTEFNDELGGCFPLPWFWHVKVKLLWFHCTSLNDNKLWLITIKCVGSFSSVSPSNAPPCFFSPVSVVADLCCGVGGGDEQVDHARLQLLSIHFNSQSNSEMSPRPTELTGRYIFLPDTSPWWCRQTLPLHRRPLRQPVWPSRPWMAAGGPRRSALPPDGRSGRRWVCTSAPYRKRRASCQMM